MKLGKINLLLLALLVAAMVMVPCVSAVDDTSEPEGEINTSVHYQLSSNYLDDWKEAKPLPESELLTVILPESSLSQDRDNERIYQIGFSPSEIENSDIFTSSSELPEYLISKNIRKNERVVLFRIPKTMYQYFKRESKNNKVSFPREFFTTYDSISDLIKDTASRKNETVSINQVKKTTPPPPLKISDRTDYSKSYNPNKLGWHNEWITFNQSSSKKATYIYGRITPDLYYIDSSDRYEIYQERELYMDASSDAIELVVTFHDMNDGANMLLFPVIWDNAVETEMNDWDHNEGFVTIPLNSVPHEYEYYAGLGTGANAGIYEIWFHNGSPDTWYYYRYLDTDNPGYYYNRIAGSSEFQWKSVIRGFFVARTIPIRDEMNYDGELSTWYYPREVWQYQNTSDNENYVSIDWSWYPDANGNQLVTNSYCDSRG
jgi:hypothetical protein